MAADLQGTQAIARACQIIQLLGADTLASGRLTDIAKVTGLPKATAHRILSALRAAGFVENINGSSEYGLGLDLLGLGTAAANRLAIRRLAEPALTRIAHASGDTAFLSIRRGGHAVCIDRQRGTYPLRSLPVDLGTRTLLGSDAGGLALLAWLPEDDLAAVLADPEIADGGRDKLVRRIAEARSADHAYCEADDQEPVGAIGIPVLDEFGFPVAAFSIAAMAARLAPPRRAELAQLLWREARQIRLMRLGEGPTAEPARATTGRT